MAYDKTLSIGPDTRLSELLARPRRSAPPGALVSRNLVRSIQQSLRVEGYEASEASIDKAARRVLGEVGPLCGSLGL